MQASAQCTEAEALAALRVIARTQGKAVYALGDRRPYPAAGKHVGYCVWDGELGGLTSIIWLRGEMIALNEHEWPEGVWIGNEVKP